MANFSWTLKRGEVRTPEPKKMTLDRMPNGTFYTTSSKLTFGKNFSDLYLKVSSVYSFSITQNSLFENAEYCQEFHVIEPDGLLNFKLVME
jgi:hypothetical protein